MRWLGKFEDLPTTLQDNNFIRRGYRMGHSTRDVFMSLFTWHNETGNIHTHLIGFALFLVLTVAVALTAPSPFAHGSDAVSRLEQRLMHFHSTGGFSNLTDYTALRRLGSQHLAEWEGHLWDAVQYGRDSLTDLPPRAQRVAAALLDLQWPTARWPLYVFLAGAMTCLLTSATCHLLSCCSIEVNHFIWRLDYAGIAVLIVTSFFPPVYYGFLCKPPARIFYLSTTAGLGLICVTVSLLESFQHYKYRPLRAGIFTALGLWGIIPAVHAWNELGHVPQVVTALKLDALMGIVYVGGAVIYALRFPERLKPGHFDYLFNSHQLFHLAVVIAAVFHYRASLTMVHWRDTIGGCSMLDVGQPAALYNASQGL